MLLSFLVLKQHADLIKLNRMIFVRCGTESSRHGFVLIRTITLYWISKKNQFMKRRSKRRVRNNRIKSISQWTQNDREIVSFVQRSQPQCKKMSKKCEDFNFGDKKGKSLRDILIEVRMYGISEKEGKARVFGGQTNSHKAINEIQSFCLEKNC